MVLVIFLHTQNVLQLLFFDSYGVTKMSTATATKAGNGNVENLLFNENGEVLEDRPCLHCGKVTPPSGWYGRHEVVRATDGFGVTCSRACEKAFTIKKRQDYVSARPSLTLVPVL